MSEFNPESLENNCRSLRNEPSLSDFQTSWIMELADKAELQSTRIAALEAAIEKHRDTLYKHGDDVNDLNDLELYVALGK